jgi:hypothetical protein
MNLDPSGSYALVQWVVNTYPKSNLFVIQYAERCSCDPLRPLRYKLNTRQPHSFYHLPRWHRGRHPRSFPKTRAGVCVRPGERPALSASEKCPSSRHPDHARKTGCPGCPRATHAKPIAFLSGSPFCCLPQEVCSLAVHRLENIVLRPIASECVLHRISSFSTNARNWTGIWEGSLTHTS